MAQSHGGGDRIVALSQPVPHHAIKCCQHGFALGRLGCGAVGSFKHGLQPGQHGIQPFTHKLRDTAHTLVNQPGDATHLPWRCAACGTQCLPHGLVQAFGNIGDTRGGLRCQQDNGPNIRGTQVLEGIAFGPGSGQWHGLVCAE